MRLQRMNRKKIARAVLDALESPIRAASIAFLIYAILASLNGPLWRETTFNYFSYLADAFLHGQTNLRVMPISRQDLIFFNNQCFLYWPAFPAVLLMPLVLIFGVHVSDVLVTVILGAINVMLVAQLLRKADEHGIAPLDKSRRAWLVLFFALGSVQLPLAPFGRVWNTSQLIDFLLISLAYLSTISLRGWKAFFFTGLFLGCALLTRSHTIFAGIWPAYFLLATHWGKDWKKISLYSLAGIVPILLALGCTLLYNYARFGDPTQVGLDYHNMDPSFVEDYRLYGALNLHYLPTNFYYQYINYHFPWREDSLMGGSLFLLSPIWFSVFPVFFKKLSQPSNLFLFLSIFVVNIPILLLMGTGWVQIGPRYTLDFTVPMLLLAAIGIKEWRLSIIQILVIISCLHYFLGTLIMSFLLS